MTETVHSPDDHEFTTMGPDAQRYDRYATVTTDDDEVILYDIDEETAWLQSDTAVSLAEVV